MANPNINQTHIAGDVGHIADHNAIATYVDTHDDTDVSAAAHHHTLGAGATQAAAGNHTHAQYSNLALEGTTAPPADAAASALGVATTAAHSDHTHQRGPHGHSAAAGDGGTLTQANTHGSPDTDTAPASLHHTLGAGANQAAAGNHTHPNTGLTLEGTATPPGINTTGSVLGAAATAAHSDHTHVHGNLDADSATTALHHTLGTGANQAAAGNHTHPSSLGLEGTTAPPSTASSSALGTATTAAHSDHTHQTGSHAHSGAAGDGPLLSQANTHQAADTDSSLTSLHHTLGGGAFQAAAGNHSHSSFGPTTFGAGNSNANVVLTVNAAANQQGDLLQFKNSSGTVVSSVDFGGAFRPTALFSAGTVFDTGNRVYSLLNPVPRNVYYAQQFLYL